MPIYEFRCANCERITEFSLKMSDPHPKECPACHQSALNKIISQTSFVLKGGGWYSDAYSAKKTDAAKEGRPSESPASEGGKVDTPAAPASSTPNGSSPPPSNQGSSGGNQGTSGSADQGASKGGAGNQGASKGGSANGDSK